MKILVTGGTGFVGSALVQALGDRGDEVVVLCRSSSKGHALFPAHRFPQVTIVPYSPLESGDWQGVVEGCDGVVNLAGEPIADRWTPSKCQAILDSRALGTRRLVEAIAQASHPPNVLVNASAVGYYGTSNTATFREDSPPGTDFLARVCQDWEEAAREASAVTRVVILRIGIVLAKGGAIAKMLMPFQLFAGGPLGDGQQWFSWIHRQDLINLILQSLDTPSMTGVYNATAPEPVKMATLCNTLGEVLSRPSWLPVPGFALELLLGEAAQVVLEGQQVLPDRALATGFQFAYPQLKPALQQFLP